ncbi:hypothetical protein CSUI_005600 [Cystoisospora suis]|uniref:Transmembrane protein n=1 Tax=Cystoisospora suis TaxID=483139 RepID=A0A2C6KT71_9APIC|nr:hypothetical protein CSUI_005600 [Cystoisospora suis]
MTPETTAACKPCWLATTSRPEMPGDSRAAPTDVRLGADGERREEGKGFPLGRMKKEEGLFTFYLFYFSFISLLTLTNGQGKSCKFSSFPCDRRVTVMLREGPTSGVTLRKGEVHFIDSCPLLIVVLDICSSFMTRATICVPWEKFVFFFGCLLARFSTQDVTA